MAEKSEEISTKQDSGSLDAKYQLKMETQLEGLSSPFAKAYAVSDKTGAAASNIYALLFDMGFPPDIDKMKVLKKNKIANFTNILDFGKITLSATKTERFAVIIERPAGKKLSEIVKGRKVFEEEYIILTIVGQIADALSTLSEMGIVHGLINANKIYYDEASGKVTVGECVSEFCGFSQDPAYDSIDRLLCHPAGKGDSDLRADYFALGMLIIFLLSGKQPFAGLDREIVIDIRMEHGSYDGMVEHMRTAGGLSFNVRTEKLLKGLLTDHQDEGWRAKEVANWMRRQEVSPPSSKLHRQTSNGMVFDEKEYFGKKYLAHDLFRKWNDAKKTIKVMDISRWMTLALKRNDIAADLDLMAGHGEIIIPDEKLSRIVNLLDTDGPIRYKDLAVHVLGIGSLLAYAYMKGERNIIQRIGEIFGDDLPDHWIRCQKDPTQYGYSVLQWKPNKVRQNILRNGLGFGIERGLYDMNKSLACQSPIVNHSYSANLHDLIVTLDNITPKEDDDPVDRQVAAFIASKLDLSDDMKIKSLQNFPHISRNPQVLMVGLLTVAQAESRVKSARNLTTWLSNRLSTMIGSLHSKGIKKEIKGKIKSASGEGNMNSIFKIIANPSYAKRDHTGYKEAKNQYRMLVMEVAKLKSKSNIQRLAYQIGLKIAVTISYLVCAMTMLYVLFYFST